MGKRLIVFCDGTWSKADAPTVTNVCKLREAVDEPPENVHYEPGVGTKPWERIRGGAFGIGLSRNVRHCYQFLVDRYEPGDELFFFGFSRGAFTARSLAGLVRNSGILRREHRARVKDAYDVYRSRKPEDKPSAQAATAFRAMYSHPDADITFVGVWDTVGALGIPSGILQPPGLNKRWAFHDTTLSKAVKNAYHAIAIDERRRPFAPTLWVKKPGEEPPPDQKVAQVWFAGVHSDVGGGYSEPALSEIPLRWIADRARECGLKLKADHLVVRPVPIAADRRRNGIDVAPDPCGRKHDSMTFFYKLLRPLDRELKCVDGDPINAYLASSVKFRSEQDRSYTAPGLADWLAGDQIRDV
jgi:uncharacterized protein (DUF2235 family)